MVGFEQNITLGVNNLNVENENQLTYALQCFNQALLEQPTNLRALFLKRSCLTNLEKDDEVAKCVEQMQLIDANSIYSMNAKARFLTKQDAESSEARRLFEAITKIDDRKLDSFLAFKIKADAYYELKDTGKTIEYYIKSLNLQETPTTINNLAYVYKEIGDYDSAIKHFEKLKEYWPEEPTIYRDVARCYVALRNSEEAFQNNLQLYRLVGDEEYDNFLSLGLEAHDTGRHEFAVEIFDKLLTKNPDPNQNHYLMILAMKLESLMSIYNDTMEDEVLEEILRVEEEMRKGFHDYKIKQALEQEVSYVYSSGEKTTIKKVSERVKKLEQEVRDHENQERAFETFATKEEVADAVALAYDFKVQQHHKGYIDSDPKLKQYFNAFYSALKVLLTGCEAALSGRLKVDNDVPILSSLGGLAEQLPFPGGAIMKSITIVGEGINKIRDNNTAVNAVKVLHSTGNSEDLLQKIATSITIAKALNILSYKDERFKIVQKMVKAKNAVYKSLYETDQEYLACQDAGIFLTLCTNGIMKALIRNNPGDNTDTIIDTAVQAITRPEMFKSQIKISVDTNFFKKALGLNSKIKEYNPDDNSAAPSSSSPFSKLKFWKKSPEHKEDPTKIWAVTDIKYDSSVINAAFEEAHKNGTNPFVLIKALDDCGLLGDTPLD